MVGAISNAGQLGLVIGDRVYLSAYAGAGGRKAGRLDGWLVRINL